MRALLLFTLVLIATFCYSQSTPKTTLTADSVKNPVYTVNTDGAPEMVSIRYRYLVASRLAFNEVWGLRKANWQQLYTIQQQDLSLKSLRKSLADKTAADSICSDELKLKTTEIEKKDSIIFNTKNLYLDATFKANDKKWTIVGLGVSLPVALALGIALGWVLHYR